MIDVIGIANAWQRMVDEAGIDYTLEWLREKDATPYTCMKTKKVFVPRPSLDWTDKDYRILTGHLVHELGHHHPSQQHLVDIMEEESIGYGSPLGMAINSVDDIWQEMITSREYIGGAQSLAYSSVECCKESIEKLQEGKIKPDPYILDLIGLHYEAKSYWVPEISVLYPDFAKFTDHDKWSYLVPRINGVVDIADDRKAAEEVVAICKEIVESTGVDPESEESKGKPEPKPGEGEGEPTDGDGESESSDKGDEEGDESVDMEISYRELMGHSHTEEGSVGKGKIKIIYDHEAAHYKPYLPHEFDVHTPPVNTHTGRYREAEKIHEATSKVGLKIANLFQSASQTGRRYQQKRGKLTTKHLNRGYLGDPRIFNRKVEKIDTKANVYFLCDCSGSMAWAKFPAMVAAVGNISHALDIAGVPHAIGGFTEARTTCTHYNFKDWSEPYKWETLAGRMCDVPLRQNADGDSLMFVYNQLLQRDSKRKILIVLSDGEPCCDRSGDADTYLKHVTKHIEDRGKVELYGIGIMTDDVKRYYKEYSVLRKTEEIESCLTEVVKTKILRK